MSVDDEAVRHAAVREVLRSLAARERRDAPPEVELRLRSEFRRRFRRRRARTWTLAAAGAAIAAMLAGAVLIRPAAPRFQPRAMASAPALPALSPEPAAASATALSEPAPRENRAAFRRVRRPLRSRARAAGDEFATRFYPLPAADFLPPAEDGAMVRIQLPRSAMRWIGLPINEERAAERVQADVLVASDGTARAVRFVQ